jgi:hypothetical protein
MRADQTSPLRSRQLSNEKLFKDPEKDTCKCIDLAMSTNQSSAECSVDGLEQSRLGSPAVQRRNRIGQMGFALETNVDRTFAVLKC